jgi:carboxypeptidase PM20D1
LLFFTNNRTFYLSFGHDEEVGGEWGNKFIAERFLQQGVRLEYVVDEGGSITEGIVPGVSKPVALIGTSGY